MKDRIKDYFSGIAVFHFFLLTNLKGDFDEKSDDDSIWNIDFNS